jgi:hypothetical protein
MIWLLPYPSPLSHQYAPPTIHKKTEKERDNLLSGEGEGVGEEPNQNKNIYLSLLAIHTSLRMRFSKHNLNLFVT